MGQVFLTDPNAAMAEAAHAHGKVVIEIGPGKGILTRELCKNAKKVIAIEKDTYLYTYLRGSLGEEYSNLKLINADFFDVSDSELESADIMISNVPYYLSSKIIDWLLEKRLQAVLCLQKEFVEHMLAKEDTRNYSKLSVFTSLFFSVTEIMKIPRGSFHPRPKVDSKIIYLKPKEFKATKEEMEMINLLMQHKKKRVKNAIIDSNHYLKLDKEKLHEIIEKIDQKDGRVFKLNPKEILKIATYLSNESNG